MCLPQWRSQDTKMEHDAKRERLSQQAFIAQDRDPFC